MISWDCYLQILNILSQDSVIYCNVRRSYLLKAKLSRVVDLDPDPKSGSRLDPYSIGSVDPDPDPGGQK
jgi:hypothetical protein